MLDFSFTVENNSNIMVYLQAYLDESGKSHSHKVASFCGFVGTFAQWNRCQETWTKLLYHNGLTELKASSSVRYTTALSSKVAAVGVDNRIKALTPFIDAIRTNVSFGVAVAVDCEAFNALPAGDRKILKEDPHYLAFRQAMALLHHRSAEIFPEEPNIHIALCCDEEQKTSAECLRIFGALRSHYPDLRKRFVSIGFGDDKYFMPLQAADLIASIARQEASRKFHGNPFDMKILYELMSTENAALAPVFGKYMDSALLSEVAKTERDAGRFEGNRP